jgi:hypothetical protein
VPITFNVDVQRFTAITNDTGEVEVFEGACHVSLVIGDLPDS